MRVHDNQQQIPSVEVDFDVDQDFCVILDVGVVSSLPATLERVLWDGFEASFAFYCPRQPPFVLQFQLKKVHLDLDNDLNNYST